MRYYSNYFQHSAVFDEESILGNLKQELRAKVVNVVLEERSILRIPLFNLVSSDKYFKLSIFPILKPVEYAPGEHVFERGHEALSVLFLLSGKVTVFSSNDDETVIATMRVSRDSSGTEEPALQHQSQQQQPHEVQRCGRGPRRIRAAAVVRSARNRWGLGVRVRRSVGKAQPGRMPTSGVRRGRRGVY